MTTALPTRSALFDISTIFATAAAYQAGRDCGLHGANRGNCDHKHFSPERLQSWRNGYESGKAAREALDELRRQYDNPLPPEKREPLKNPMDWMKESYYVAAKQRAEERKVAKRAAREALIEAFEEKHSVTVEPCDYCRCGTFYDYDEETGVERDMGECGFCNGTGFVLS